MPSPHTRDLTDYAVAFAPFLAVLVAISVAAMQYYLQKQHLKQQLFERRFQVYSAVREFLSHALRGYAPLDNDAYQRFYLETRPAKFLFGSDVADFIREIRNGISHEENDGGAIVRYVEPDDADNPDDPLTTLMKWGHQAEVTFGRYLRVHHDRWWLARLKARLDEWMESEERVMESGSRRRG